MIKQRTCEKIATVILKARQDRNTMDSKATIYIESVEKKNLMIDSIIRKTLQKVLSDLRISERVFRDSMLNTRAVEPGLRFIELKVVVASGGPPLKPEDLMKILNYYMKSMRNVLDLTYTNLMGDELLSHINDDKIYWKFGVERSQVMAQARDLAESHEGVSDLLESYFQLRETIDGAN